MSLISCKSYIYWSYWNPSTTSTTGANCGSPGTQMALHPGASVWEALLRAQWSLHPNPSRHMLVALCEAALGRTILHPERQCDVDPYGRWRPETHIFHFQWGEMTVTLQNISFLTGLPIRTEPLVLDRLPANWKPSWSIGLTCLSRTAPIVSLGPSWGTSVNARHIRGGTRTKMIGVHYFIIHIIIYIIFKQQCSK